MDNPISESPHGRGKDEVIEAVGLPSMARYNWLVAASLDALKKPADYGKAQVLATLAQAEATVMTRD